MFDFGAGFIGSSHPNLLSLLKHTRIDDADNDQTRNDQSQSHKGYKKDAAPTGWEFPPDDPILDLDTPHQPLRATPDFGAHT